MTNFKLLSLAAILSFIGANAMRSFFALGLLIALCASASAATARHSRHVIVHHEHAYAVRGTLRLGRSTTTTHRATTIHPSLAAAINPYWFGP